MATQTEESRLLSLPQEIRQQIYEHVITYSVNFIYKSTAQFKESRLGWDIHDTVYTKKKLKRLRRKHGPCGVTFKIAPSPKFVDDTYDTVNLLLVNKRFSSDIKSAAHHIRLKISAAISKSLTGANSHSQFWTDSGLTPQLLEIIRSSRHIFAGYGHNTFSTALLLPPEVAQNIESIFLTEFVLGHYYTQNWGPCDRLYIRRRLSFSMERFMLYFPNCKTLAVACGTEGRITRIQTRDYYITKYVTMAFNNRRGLQGELALPNLRAFETVYKRRENRDQQASISAQWSKKTWDGEMSISKARRVSDLELEGRGRYWSDYEHILDEFRDELAEGIVWRVLKEQFVLGNELEHSYDPDFEDPFVDLDATEIFVEREEPAIIEPKEPIMWEERCWRGVCTCGNECKPLAKTISTRVRRRGACNII
ncbi:hypothetical protein TWF718_003483 [Orbilia javanica]|uniref:Uncharacterized protein n=1 Tax=Orbilia javanica TaxID=47235 RepID=A0AAN8MPB7_9PEZI